MKCPKCKIGNMYKKEDLNTIILWKCNSCNDEFLDSKYEVKKNNENNI